MGLRRRTRHLLRRLRHPPTHTTHAAVLAARAALLKSGRINVVLDIGANTGQYAKELRAAGYRHRIVSFEPLSAAFEELRRHAQRDSRWQVYPYALGDAPGRARLNVAGNSVSSSLLPMHHTHREAAPHSAYVAAQRVTVRTLDEMAPDILHPHDRVWLKLDTQGYEGRVLAGATTVLSRTRFVQIELSLVELYRGAPTMDETCALLHTWHYRLVALEPGFTDPATGRMLQLDGIFKKRRAASRGGVQQSG
jgi:FkbM family methyltransferase